MLAASQGSRLAGAEAQYCCRRTTSREVTPEAEGNMTSSSFVASDELSWAGHPNIIGFQGAFKTEKRGRGLSASFVR